MLTYDKALYLLAEDRTKLITKPYSTWLADEWKIDRASLIQREEIFIRTVGNTEISPDIKGENGKLG